MFSCNNCSSLFQSILMYNDHQKVHKSSATNSISCLYSHFNSFLKIFLSFRKHLLRFHRSHLFYSCEYYCCSYKCSSLLSLQKDRKNHSPATTIVKCQFCESRKHIFCNDNTYRCHMFKNHINTNRICKSDTSFSEKISSTSKKVKDIVHSLERRYSDTFQSNASNLTNASPNLPKISKFNDNANCDIDIFRKDVLHTAFLQDSTVLDVHSEFVINKSSTIESPKNNNASYTEYSQTKTVKTDVIRNYPSEIVKTSTDDEFKIRNVSIVDHDDENFEEMSNSLIVNALNWEFEHYMTCITDKTEDSDPTKSLAKIYVKLAVKNFATQPVLQGIMSNLYSAFDLCRIQFYESLSHLNVENSDLIRNVFDNSFNSFINSHNPKTGILRSTYTRKKYYKQ